MRTIGAREAGSRVGPARVARLSQLWYGERSKAERYKVIALRRRSVFMPLDVCDNMSIKSGEHMYVDMMFRHKLMMTYPSES